MSSRDAVDRGGGGPADPLADVPRALEDVAHAMEARGIVARAFGEELIERGVLGIGVVVILLGILVVMVGCGVWLTLSAIVSITEHAMGNAVLARGIVGAAVIAGPLAAIALMSSMRSRRRRMSTATSVDHLLGTPTPGRPGRTLADLDREARARAAASGRVAMDRVRYGFDPRSLVVHHPAWLAAGMAAALGAGCLLALRRSRHAAARTPDAPIAPPSAPQNPLATALAPVIARAAVLLMERFLTPPAQQPEANPIHAPPDRQPNPSRKAA